MFCKKRNQSSQNLSKTHEITYIGKNIVRFDNVMLLHQTWIHHNAIFNDKLRYFNVVKKNLHGNRVTPTS